jgi:NADH-quinone oxidoreductase subunit N
LNAPIIWVGFSLVVAVSFWFLQNRKVLVAGLAAGYCLLMACIAGLASIDIPIRLGSFSFEIHSTLEIFGRLFVLGDNDRYLLVLLFGFGAFWFTGAGISRSHRFFIPLGMGIIALLVAALAVEPFLYAALLVEMAVLLSIPLLLPPGKTIGQGLIRYLVFQTLAVPFILLAGWSSAGVEANPSNQTVLLQTVVLLGLGFAFWLAVFPFYTWIPLLAYEAQPYAAGFILSLLPTVALFLALKFLNAFIWLRDFPSLSQILQIAGLVMVLSGGVWAAFQKDLSRMFGYAVILETGYSLLALSLRTTVSYEVFASQFLPRILALALWALALSVAKQKTSLDFDGVQGLARKMPFAAFAIVLSGFSIAGVPLLGGFPPRQILLENLAQQSFTLVILAVIGNFGLLVGCLRLLGTIISEKKEPWKVEEDLPKILMLSIGGALLLIIGIFPGWILPSFFNLLKSIEFLL